VDGFGNPLRFELTAGQRHDITQAQALIADFETEHVIADKGYDSVEFLQSVLSIGAIAVIPPDQIEKRRKSMMNICIESATSSNALSTRSNITGTSSLALTNYHRVSWDS